MVPRPPLHLSKLQSDEMPAEALPRLTYLAAPYRHPTKAVQDARLEAVSRVAAGFTDIDRRVFCPLTYAQALLDHGFGH